MDSIVIGIDASRDRLDVMVLPSREQIVVSRTADGVDQLVGRLLQRMPAIVAVQTAGGFETIVTAKLSAVGIPVVIVSPAQLHNFVEAEAGPSADAPIDAGTIARYAMEARPHLGGLAERGGRVLADLVARRWQIIQMIIAERQRQKRPLEPRLQGSIARLTAALESELSILDDDLAGTGRETSA